MNSMKPAGGVSAVAIACLMAAFVGMETPQGQETACLVATSDGDIQGVDRGASCAFLGIPYAAPPVGPLRWRPPQPAAPSPLINATSAPPSCPTVQQPAGTLAGAE